MGTSDKPTDLDDSQVQVARSIVGVGALLAAYVKNGTWAVGWGAMFAAAIHEVCVRLRCCNTTLILATTGALMIGGRVGHLLDVRTPKSRPSDVQTSQLALFK